MAYAIVRTDRMQGTVDPASLVSVRYMGTGNTPTAIENGNVVKLSGLLAEQRDIHKGVKPAVDTPLSDVVLIASVELMYDERKKSLNEFINEAGNTARGYRLRSGNIFSVTKEALSGVEAAVGNIVELAADTKLKVVATATSGSTKVGTIVHKETFGTETFYAIEIA